MTSGSLAADPGLQPQRTALAWQRTALATVAAGLVGAAPWLHLGWWPVAGLAAAVGLGAAAAGWRSGASGASTGRGPWPGLRLLAGGAATLGLLGATSVVVTLSR